MKEKQLLLLNLIGVLVLLALGVLVTIWKVL